MAGWGGREKERETNEERRTVHRVDSTLGMAFVQPASRFWRFCGFVRGPGGVGEVQGREGMY